MKGGVDGGGLIRNGLIGAALLWCASWAQADCKIEPVPEVHVGEVGIFEAGSKAMANKLAERFAQVSITCPKGAVYTLRAMAAPEEALVGDVVNMANLATGQAMRMAVVLESFNGDRVQRRFSALPMSRYTAVGTGTPQMALLRLELADGPSQKRMDRRTAPVAGSYRASLRLEVDLQGATAR